MIPINCYDDYRCEGDYTDLEDGKKYIFEENLFENHSNPKLKNFVDNIIRPNDIKSITEPNRQKAKLSAPFTYTHVMFEGLKAGQKDGWVNYMFIDSDEKKPNHPTPDRRINVEKQLEENNISYCSYFTTKHDFKNQHDNYRIIIPISGYYEMEDYEKIKPFIESHADAGIVVGDFIFDNRYDVGATFRSGQMYLPYKWSNKDPHVKVFYAGELDISATITKSKEYDDIIQSEKAFQAQLNSQLFSDEIDELKQVNCIQNWVYDPIDLMGTSDRYKECFKIGCTAGSLRMDEYDLHTHLQTTGLPKGHVSNVMNGYKVGIIGDVNKYILNKRKNVTKESVLNAVDVKKIVKRESILNKKKVSYQIKSGEYLSNNDKFLTDLKTFVDAGKTIIINAPTGSGKTELICKYLDRAFVLAQPFQEICKYVNNKYNLNVVMEGKHPENNKETSEVTTYDGLVKFPKFFYSEHVLVVDESHLLLESASYRKKAVKNVVNSILDGDFKANILMSGTPEHMFLFNPEEVIHMNVERIGAPIKKIRLIDTFSDKRSNTQRLVNEIQETDKDLQLLLNNNKAENAFIKTQLESHMNVILIDTENTENSQLINDQEFLNSLTNNKTVIIVTKLMECGIRLPFSPDVLHINYDAFLGMTTNTIQQISERPERAADGSDNPIMDVRVYYSSPENVEIKFSNINLELEYKNIVLKYDKNTKALKDLLERENMNINNLWGHERSFFNLYFSKTYIDECDKILQTNYDLFKFYNKALMQNLVQFAQDIEKYNCKTEFTTLIVEERPNFDYNSNNQDFRDMVLIDIENDENNTIMYNPLIKKYKTIIPKCKDSHKKYICVINGLSRLMEDRVLFKKIIKITKGSQTRLKAITRIANRINNSNIDLKISAKNIYSGENVQEVIHYLNLSFEVGEKYLNTEIVDKLKNVSTIYGDLDVNDITVKSTTNFLKENFKVKNYKNNNNRGYEILDGSPLENFIPKSLCNDFLDSF